MPHADRSPERPGGGRSAADPGATEPSPPASRPATRAQAGSSNVRAGQRIRLYEGDTAFFGPGPHELLVLVAQTGSLLQAAKQMRMSYSKAWRLVGEAEAHLGVKLLERRAGGAAGGGSALTPEGERLVAGFAALQADADAELARLFRRHFGDEPYVRRATGAGETEDA